MNNIDFTRRKLSNGLTVIVHHDRASAMASINLLYKVGARNENPLQTGVAHLFEHLMFEGSARVPSFDEPLQKAAGENNAFTNNDYTNYYIALPAANIETALFVEADRMASLTLSDEKVELQKKVVIEEFAQRYTNQPYGDVWHLLRSYCYEKNHPYSWPTIGLDPSHIESVTTQDARAFYAKYYSPSNAILSIASPIESEHVFELVEKWFGGIASGEAVTSPLAGREVQYLGGRYTVERDVAASTLYICYPIGGRTSREAIVMDVATDLLSGGESSRLVQRLVKGEALFSSINCYISAEEGPGMVVATGQLMDGVSIEVAEAAMTRELQKIATEPIAEQELQKIRNKMEANNYFSQINSLNKAMNLAYFEFLGDASMINEVVTTHHSVTAEQIAATAADLFVPAKATTLHYLRN